MKKIFVAGHRGMVGSAICRQLQTQSGVKIITRSSNELDLCDQAAVQKFMKLEKPDEIIIAAAKVGGIHANNTYPAEFIYQNLQIQNNIIHAAHISDVQKLLFLGSSCIYPSLVAQPMRENALLTGMLEPNLDQGSYEKNTQPMLSHINIGTGTDVTIKELAETVKDVVGFRGEIVFDPTKPDGTPRKLLDVNVLNELGWTSSVDLRTGLKLAIEDFTKQNG